MLLATFLFVIMAGFMSCQVFAEVFFSISISSYSVEMILSPGLFGEESQTITASTSNAAGYTVGIRTIGQSSALTNI